MALPPPLAIPANLYKNDDLVRRRLNPEPKSLKWPLRQECVEKMKLILLQWARLPADKRDRHRIHELGAYSFENCPANILQDVYTSVINDESSSKILKCIFELLLVNGLSHFDFTYVSECSMNELTYIFQLIKSHGLTMKSLKVAGRWIYSSSAEEVIKQLITSCPNLECCTLQEATLDELICLARNCPQIKRLEILHPSIKSRDIEEFCKVVKREKLLIQRSLTSISLPSSVDRTGIHVVLEFFSNITDISCIHLEQFMHDLNSRIASESKSDRDREPANEIREKIASEDETDQTGVKQNMKQLSSENGKDDDVTPDSRPVNWIQICSKIKSIKVTQVMGWKSLELLTTFFPNLERVHLKIQEIMNLRELSKLLSLKSLYLENSQVIPSSYTQDVLPLLQQIGARLTHLGLAHFDVVELPKTHNFCPNLISLDLQHFTLLGCTADRFHRLQYSDKKTRTEPFKKLRFLRLRARARKFISTEACEMVLSNCKSLAFIELHEAYGLNDSLAEKLMAVNGFEHLLSIRLKGVHGLSRTGIETLLCKSKRLQVCHIP